MFSSCGITISAFSILFMTSCKAAASELSAADYYEIITGITISGHDFKALPGRGEVACAQACIADVKCAAFSLLANDSCMLSQESDISQPSPWALSGRRRTVPWCSPSEGGKVYLGWINDDNQPDLICHNGVKRTLSFALTLGKISLHFKPLKQVLDYPHCPSEHDTVLRIGDVNGDKLSDIFCDDRTLKNKTLSILHKSNWTLFVENTFEVSGFCLASTDSPTHLGRFTNDGFMQLVCHNQNGTMFLFGIKVGSTEQGSYNREFCQPENNTEGRLLVRRLGRDSYDDLICHGKSSTDAMFGNSNRKFPLTQKRQILKETDCPFGSFLDSGHFDGDGRPDLVCITGAGSERKMRIFFGQNDNVFFSDAKKWEGNFTWCADPNSTIYVGDFRGKYPSLFLCHGQDGSLDVIESPHEE